MREYVSLLPGDPAPQFYQRTALNPNYAFHTAAGRYAVLCFFGSAADVHGRAAVEAVKSRASFFDEKTACFFGLSLDPDDEARKRVADDDPAYQYFWDFDFAASRLYGAVPKDVTAKDGPAFWKRLWVVLDPMLRVMQVIPFRQDRSDIAALLTYIDGLPPPSRFAGFELPAPIIMLPNVFEPEFCQRLIALYASRGGQEVGVMREVDGKTVGVTDSSYKSRRDFYIEDKGVILETQARLVRRVFPEIAKVHQFQVTRMERYIVSCYSADEGGHFEAHRDNTMKGTAHRRFAVTINLNDDYEGGELSFPEYGSRSFKPPVGCAVVFSCSLLHAVSRMTRGRRYAFLPFLYDDEAAKIREQNSRYLAQGAGAFKAG
jgi:predicted 2-oxoglutarate/Fe(II)-dependent dioxygenase YbiX/peroxiredoxin